jgi:hypothetical protein
MHFKKALRSIFVATLLGTFALGSQSCGSKNKDSANSKDNGKGKTGKGGGNLNGEDGGDSEGAAGALVSGKYKLASAQFSATLSSGQEIPDTRLQVSGPGSFRTLQKIEDNLYRMTVTGDAVLLNNNEELTDFKCQGAQDVFTFSLSETGSMEEIAYVESGCQSNGNTGSENSTFRIENVTKTSFSIIEVSTGDGNRGTLRLSFTLVNKK